MRPGSGEFARGWRVVLASALGAGLGVSGLLTYNSGLFVHDLTGDIGLSRTAYGAALFGSTLAMAAAMPLVARAVDRFGPRATAVFGGAMLALGFALLAAGLASVPGYWAIMLLIGLLAAPSTPVAFTRAVSGLFERSRGLALGLLQMGIGASAALVPPLVSWAIAGYGWRSGYWLLALLALLGCIPSLLGLPGRAAQAPAGNAEAARRARASRTFRIQLAAFTTMAFAFAGMLSHFVPMLRDGGMSAERAGALAGLIGLSVIVSRLIVGWLADRMEAAWLGAASCLLCGAGCLVLAFGGPTFAPAAAIALGSAMGAEADLIGFLTARHFGIAAYSRVYAFQYGLFMVAAGVSPLWVGFLADRTGGYQAALVACPILLLVPVLLFGLLPRTFATERSSLSGS